MKKHWILLNLLSNGHKGQYIFIQFYLYKFHDLLNCICLRIDANLDLSIYQKIVYKKNKINIPSCSDPADPSYHEGT